MGLIGVAAEVEQMDRRQMPTGTIVATSLLMIKVGADPAWERTRSVTDSILD